MPNIDTLTIQFGSKGTETAVKNIKTMASAVRTLSGSLRMMDMSKFGDGNSQEVCSHIITDKQDG